MANLLPHPGLVFRTMAIDGASPVTSWPTMSHLPPHPGNYGAPSITHWRLMTNPLPHPCQLWRISCHTPGYWWRNSGHNLTNYGAPPATPWPTMTHLLLHPDWLWRTFYHNLANDGVPPNKSGLLWRTFYYTLTDYGAPSTTPWPTMAHLLPHLGQLWRTFCHTLANYGTLPITFWPTMSHLRPVNSRSEREH